MNKTSDSVAEDVAAPAVPARRKLLTAAAAGIGVAATKLVVAAAPARSKPPLTAQTTEGPYYFDPKLVRADITEGLPGVPLDVRILVIDENGAPFGGARVDIWHCNASGFYSGYSGQGDDRSVSTKGKTFLRGTQIADERGVVVFRTIYPGWYDGRTTHIHFKVVNGSRAVLTSQFFLPDALSEFLYTSLPDYKRSRLRDTLNSNDGIALQAGDTVLGSVRQEADRYVASLNVAADRSADPVIDRPPVPGEGPPPGSEGSAAAARRGPPPSAFNRRSLAGQERLAALVPSARKN